MKQTYRIHRKTGWDARELVHGKWRVWCKLVAVDGMAPAAALVKVGLAKDMSPETYRLAAEKLKMDNVNATMLHERGIKANRSLIGQRSQKWTDYASRNAQVTVDKGKPSMRTYVYSDVSAPPYGYIGRDGSVSFDFLVAGSG